VIVAYRKVRPGCKARSGLAWRCFLGFCSASLARRSKNELSILRAFHIHFAPCPPCVWREGVRPVLPTSALWLIATLISVFVGHLIVSPVMRCMERLLRLRPHGLFEPLDLWVGGTERAVATTLIFYAPKYLAAFIGGWVVLKFALGWQRERTGRMHVPEVVVTHSFLALGGNVISFAIAVVVGVLFHPASLDAWSEAPPIPF
jgi:hypothetical protein